MYGWIQGSSHASSLVDLEIFDLLLNNSFWRNLELVLKLSEPLVKVIHLVDSDDRLAMGYLYGAIDRAKETIEANIKKKKSIAFHVGGLLIIKKCDYQMQNTLHSGWRLTRDLKN